MKTYIIGIDRPDSRRRVEVLRNALGGIGEPVWGTDGKLATTKDLMRHASVPCQYLCTRTMIAIAMSHMQAWQKARDDDADLALIFEDDAIVPPDFPAKLRRVLEASPPFDILLLGCFNCGMETSPGIHPIRALFGGLHAYVVSREGLRALAEKSTKAEYHVDVQLGFKHLRIFKVVPDLVVQDFSTSTNADMGRSPRLMNEYARNVHVSKNVPLRYFMNSPVCRVGPLEHPLELTPWHLVYAAAGFLAARRSPVAWAGVASFLLLESGFRLLDSKLWFFLLFSLLSLKCWRNC